MTDIVKIDDEIISADDFIKMLKLGGRFEGLLEDVVKERLTVHAAKRQGIKVTEDEIQARADQLRRVRGLHRAADTSKFLEAMGITIEELETFIIDTLYQEKVMEQVCSEAAVNEYFNLNSPRFDNIEVCHIVVDSEGKAREIMSLLEEEPDMFDEMSREHSLADTRDSGGSIGKVMRGSLPPEVEGKIFNAEPGELIGPFTSDDGNLSEIFRVDARNSATLDGETTEEIRRLLRDEWLAARAREHNIEPL